MVGTEQGKAKETDKQYRTVLFPFSLNPLEKKEQQKKEKLKLIKSLNKENLQQKTSGNVFACNRKAKTTAERIVGCYRFYVLASFILYEMLYRLIDLLST